MKNLLWLPIDIPLIPLKNKLLNDFTSETSWKYWEFKRLTNKQLSPYDVSAWSSETETKFPKLIKWFEYFPFKNIRNIKINSQLHTVKRHIDFTDSTGDIALWENNNINEPCGYRIIIKGKRQNALYIEKQDKTKIYCNMPTNTDVYVLNHTAGYHGVDDDIGRCTIFCHAEIDNTRHRELIEQSLRKYQQFAIWD
jgi:hypothetical protein